MVSKELSRRGFVAAATAGGTAAFVSACGASGESSTCDAAMAAKTHFVLIHGAWHSAWCWDKVVSGLRAKGHAVTAMDLPGRWMRHEQVASFTPDDFVRTVGQIIENSAQPVVLVGHSLGGVTLSLTAERYASRIRRLIYLTAFLVPNGQTQNSIAMADKGSLIPQALELDLAAGVSTIKPDAARATFYGDCSDDDVRIATQLLSPESMAMATLPMKVTPAAFGSVDRVYIECLQDRAISIDTQRSMQAQTPCRRVITLNASHSPFLSQPDAVVQALLSEA